MITKPLYQSPEIQMIPLVPEGCFCQSGKKFSATTIEELQEDDYEWEF